MYEEGFGAGAWRGISQFHWPNAARSARGDVYQRSFAADEAGWNAGPHPYLAHGAWSYQNAFGGAPAGVSQSWGEDFPAAAPAGPPLRVIHVAQHLVRAGIEMWLKALLRFSDPRRVRFERCVVTSSWCDRSLIRELAVPIEIGGEDSVRRAATDCDLLLVSGPPEIGDWLGASRPLCVCVAHGDGVWTRNILERCAGVIDHVVAVSRRAQRATCDGFPTTVIYNGVDPSHLARTADRDSVRARFGFGPDDFVVGGVMRLSVEKRPELLVEALAYLPRHVKLLLVGWGALQPKLLDYANRLAPTRCVITAAQGPLGDYYQAFDAFCLPSQFEGFGLATLEALLCGVPVITTNTGFAPELLLDKVHYLQCELNADSIAQSIRTLLDHPRWAAGLAREGQAAAEQFGFAPRMCREYEQLFDRLWTARQTAA